MCRFGKNLNMEQIKEQCKNFLVLLDTQKEIIAETLLQIETLSTIEDELERCKKLILNLDKQSNFLSVRFNRTMAVFLPLNQPLYSFLLQVFLPSLILEKVYYRPPAKQSEIHSKLFELFKPTCKNIEICAVSRRKFIKNFVERSNIVNFTGKYENICDLIKILPSNIGVIYNGSAINPIVVGADADIKLSVNDTIVSRLYNSGQDCMAPSCIFVHENVTESFINSLKNTLDKITVGKNTDDNVVVGTMIEQDSITNFEMFKSLHNDKLIFGGKIDKASQIVYPAIFHFKFVDTNVQNIYYAPYFIVMSFKSTDDVSMYLNSDFCEHYAGYISLYGKSVQKIKWRSGQKNLVPLNDCTLFSAEDGNCEFGGYGMGCGFVYYNNTFESHPILILREINEIMRCKNGCVQCVVKHSRHNQTSNKT